MNVLVTGASGLVGNALLSELRSKGDRIGALARPQGHRIKDIANIGWTPQTGQIDEAELQKFGKPDAVVHLAGENIASKRWSVEQKRKIRDSRVESTRMLCQSLVKLGPPKVFVAASAVGFYGNRGEEIL